jgi:hypothetical protein
METSRELANAKSPYRRLPQREIIIGVRSRRNAAFDPKFNDCQS